jgi:hypothetical protein
MSDESVYANRQWKLKAGKSNYLKITAIFIRLTRLEFTAEPPLSDHSFMVDRTESMKRKKCCAGSVPIHYRPTARSRSFRITYLFLVCRFALSNLLAGKNP